MEIPDILAVLIVFLHLRIRTVLTEPCFYPEKLDLFRLEASCGGTPNLRDFVSVKLTFLALLQKKFGQF